MNKKGEGLGIVWVIVILFLFLSGLAYVILNQVLTVNIQTSSDDLIDNSPYLNATEKADVKLENDKYMSFWHSMPFILVFLFILYLIVSGIRKGAR